MTRLDTNDCVTRLVGHWRRWTKRSADKPRQLVATMDAFGVEVRGKGLPSSTARLSWTHLIYYAQRHTAKKKPLRDLTTEQAMADARRAIHDAYPDRAESILHTLGIE